MRSFISTVFYRMTITADAVLTGLFIAVAVMLIVVLYHVLFIIVDVRKIVRRVEGVSHQVEELITKPLQMTDHILEWVLDYIQSFEKKGEHKKHDHKAIDID